MSNGGEMCYQLAAQRPRLFAAVAPVSGLMLEWLYKADTSDVPVPLFEIHGTADRTSAWEGDLDNKGGWGAYVAVPMAVHYWAAKNKCTGMQTDTIPGVRRRTAARSSPTASRAARAARSLALRDRRRETFVGRTGHRHGRGALEIFQQVREIDGTAAGRHFGHRQKLQR